MLAKLKTIGVLRHSTSRATRVYEGEIFLVNGSLRFFCNASCKMSDSGNTGELAHVDESPEIPAWVKFCENGTHSASGSDDDFVIPTVADWVDDHELQNRRRVVRSMPSETTDGDVDKISKILKNRFPSPNEVAQALNGCSVNVSESLVKQLLVRFGNDWVSAFGVFKWAKAQMGYAHSADLYTTMIDVLGKRKEFDLMWELVEEMHRDGQHVSLVTMSKIMRRLARAKKWTDAIDAFRRIEQYGISKDIKLMNGLMDSLVKENSVEHAQNVFLEFKNQIPPDTRTFNILIHGWCKVRKLDVAWKIVEDMGNHGCRPDAISYTSFIEAHCRDKDFPKVDSILDEMKKKGCAPTTITYTIVMHALGKAKEIDKSLKVCEEMKQNGCNPDTPFYSSLIYILGEAGRLNDARDMFKDMKKQGLSPDVTTYNTMISLACLHSQEEAALKLLKEMEDVSCKPDVKTYAPLLKMCCRKKRMKVLNFLLAHMLKNDVSIELGTYSLLVNGLCKNGKLEHACLFFEEIVSKGYAPMDATYKLLMKELERKNMKKAKELIEKLMLLAKSEVSDLQIQSDLFG